MRGLGSPAAGGCGCETGLHDQPGSAGKGGCSAGCRHRPRALCRTAAAAAAASGPGTETVPVCAATEEAVADTVSSWSTMHRCESIGRVDWAAAGSLPPSKSLLLYLVSAPLRSRKKPKARQRRRSGFCPRVAILPGFGLHYCTGGALLLQNDDVVLYLESLPARPERQRRQGIVTAAGTSDSSFWARE